MHTELLTSSLLSELRRLELVTRRKVNADMVGVYRSAFRGSGLVFSDLREYQPGDDTRAIHWKASARTGRVLVKSYEEERQLHVVLAVDTSASMLFASGSGAEQRSNQRRALEFAAALAVLAHSSGDAVGLLTFAAGTERYLAPQSRRSQIRRILLELIRERDRPRKTDLAGALEFLRRNVRPHALIFLISDFVAPDHRDQLRALARRCDLICVRLPDTISPDVAGSGLVEFEDPESGERILLDIGADAAALDALARKHSAETEARIRGAGADLLTLRHQPLRQLSELMRARARRMR